jgi:NodT family efflux transporter outer membrane factor (OMF) lipoprotein
MNVLAAAPFRRLLLTALLLLCTGCMVGPNYKRPAAIAPSAFKEPPPPNFKEAEAEGWKQSQPGDAFLKGKWWEVYNDSELNALEEQVSLSNENVLQAEAQYLEAKAGVREARSSLFPAVTTSPSVNASRNGVSSGTATSAAAAAGTIVSASSGTRTSFVLPFAISWEPDLWGSIRRNITASKALAQGFEADLENARLLYQSELAEDYFNLHGVDSEIELLKHTEDLYREFLGLTRNRFSGGIASDLDVAQAESQLYGVQAALIDLGVQRAQLDHAIAILIGKPPAHSSVPPRILANLPPPIPVGLPSELLERRPDIAGAERRVAAANEQIGIAMAAFYPSLTLSGTAGVANSSLLQLVNWPSRFWSVGSQLAETLFDAGRRRAIVAQQRAAYDATVDAYRQTVLTAFQQVEDNLAALRILEEESGITEETIQASDRALRVSTAQYRAGTTSYLTVLTTQATLLTAQRSAVTLIERRLTASVLLIEALGGGWNTAKLQ